MQPGPDFSIFSEVFQNSYIRTWDFRKRHNISKLARQKAKVVERTVRIKLVPGVVQRCPEAILKNFTASGFVDSVTIEPLSASGTSVSPTREEEQLYGNPQMGALH
jgi:hypothetical protein